MLNLYSKFQSNNEAMQYQLGANQNFIEFTTGIVIQGSVYNMELFSEKMIINLATCGPLVTINKALKTTTIFYPIRTRSRPLQ